MANTKRKKINKKPQGPKKSYKNAILMLISFVLFAYSGLVLLYPSILGLIFSKKSFCDSVYSTSALITYIDKLEFQVTPTLDMIISIKGWDSKHIDKQNAFEAKEINIVTTPFSVFTRNFNIKSMEFRGVRLWEQITPEGENKLAYIARCFNPKDFGAEKITIKPSSATFKNFTILHEENRTTREEYIPSRVYSQYDVKKFIESKNLMNVKVK